MSPRFGSSQICVGMELVSAVVFLIVSDFVVSHVYKDIVAVTADSLDRSAGAIRSGG